MTNKNPQINTIHKDGNRKARRAKIAKKRLARGNQKKENIRYAHDNAFEIAKRVERNQSAAHERALIRKEHGKKDKSTIL